jgi:hypothetical protein
MRIGLQLMVLALLAVPAVANALEPAISFPLHDRSDQAASFFRLPDGSFL